MPRRKRADWLAESFDGERCVVCSEPAVILMGRSPRCAAHFDAVVPGEAGEQTALFDP